MDKELDQLRKEKDTVYRELLVAKERYEQANQAWLMCLQRRLFTRKPSAKVAK